jgi:hypothetical protein
MGGELAVLIQKRSAHCAEKYRLDSVVVEPFVVRAASGTAWHVTCAVIVKATSGKGREGVDAILESKGEGALMRTPPLSESLLKAPRTQQSPGHQGPEGCVSRDSLQSNGNGPCQKYPSKCGCD